MCIISARNILLSAKIFELFNLVEPIGGLTAFPHLTHLLLFELRGILIPWSQLLLAPNY